MTSEITLVKIIDNDEILDKSIGQILISNSYKNSNIKLVLIDKLNNIKTKKYIDDNKLNDIVSIESSERSIASIYEEYRKKITSKYVNFSTSSTFFEHTVLDSIVKHLENNDCVITCLEYYPLDNLKYTLNYFILENTDYKDRNYLTIDKDYYIFNPLLDSYFFNYDAVKDIEFEDSEYGIYKYEMNIMLELKKYLFTKEVLKHINILENDFNNNYLQYDKEWYIDFAKDYALPYLKEHNEKWIQSNILYLIGIRYSSNMNARNKNVLNDEELEIFEKYVQEILKYIDYDILKDFNSSYVSRTIIEMFINMKSNSNLKLYAQDNKVVLKHDDELVLESEQMSLDIMVLEYEDNKLCLDGEILSSIFITDESKLKAYVNDEEIKYKRNDVYTYTKVFNKIRHKKYSFRLEIPIQKLSKKKNEIYFEYKYDGFVARIPLVFKKPSSKLNVNWNNTYYRFDKKMLTYDINASSIIVKNKHWYISAKKELGLLAEYLVKSTNKVLGVKSIGLRILYWITKPFFKKRIWVSFDKLFKGGDNGEYFYHYVSENRSDVKMCYVINKTCVDYKRMIKDNCKHVYPYRSIKHYLNVLNCEFMFATHANPYDYNGFTSGVEKYFRDLLTFKTFCIQHGLSVNQIAKFQNRVYASTKLYFCASKYEIKNLNLPEYDYDGYDALRLTGVPRYDGLKNAANKTILITPTWRQSSSSKLVHLNMARQYNTEFKNSEYFRIYNTLINDKKLIDCAKECGYRIVYLLHPAVSSQLKDFDKNEYVDVIAAAGNMSYEKILTESSLMVTDYSGVQFDFAYMRKPIVYYHPTTLPPHYEESCFKYDSMGFGPIIEEENELVDSLCEYMRNDCKMKEEYIKRANDFFEYDDFNNCKRIVEEVDKYIEKHK